MNLIKRNSLKKTALIALSVIAILLGSGLVYVYAFDGSLLGWGADAETQSTPTSDKATQEQINAGDETKPGGSDKPPSPTPQPDSDKNSVEMLFTAANQNSGLLQLRVLISSVVNTGECTLTMEKDTSSITRTASVQPLASTSTCKGFDIPLSELSVGTWQATVVYDSPSLTGTTSKAITIQ